MFDINASSFKPIKSVAGLCSCENRPIYDTIALLVRDGSAMWWGGSPYIQARAILTGKLKDEPDTFHRYDANTLLSVLKPKSHMTITDAGDIEIRTGASVVTIPDTATTGTTGHDYRTTDKALEFWGTSREIDGVPAYDPKILAKVMKALTSAGVTRTSIDLIHSPAHVYGEAYRVGARLQILMMPCQALPLTYEAMGRLMCDIKGDSKGITDYVTREDDTKNDNF